MTIFMIVDRYVQISFSISSRCIQFFIYQKQKKHPTVATYERSTGDNSIFSKLNSVRQ